MCTEKRETTRWREGGRGQQDGVGEERVSCVRVCLGLHEKECGV